MKVTPAEEKANKSNKKKTESSNNGGGVCGRLVLEFAIPGEDDRHVSVMIESADDMSSLGDVRMMESDDSYETIMNKMLQKLTQPSDDAIAQYRRISMMMI